MGSAGPRGDLGVPARYEQRVVEAAAERGGGGSGGGATDSFSTNVFLRRTTSSDPGPSWFFHPDS